MYDYLNESQKHTNVVGSFTIDKNQDFKDGVKQLVEGFRGAGAIDPIDDLTKLLKAEMWCRLAATAPIQPLAWGLPYAAGAALKSKINNKLKKKINIICSFKEWILTLKC